MIGAPEVVGEFGVEPGNERVARGNVQQREQPSVVHQAVGGRHSRAGDALFINQTRGPPKQGGGGVDQPSVLRQARMTLATCSPQARPRAIETLLPVLPGVLASESVSWASSAAACDG